MNYIHKCIKMKLLSDALSGVSITTGGIVNQQFSNDKYGLPFIPAKRIRGLLREGAEELVSLKILEKDQIQELFGCSGEKNSSLLKIDDGALSYYENLVTFLDDLYNSSSNRAKEIKKIYSPQSFIDYYSYVRTQTTIENEVAKSKSLRFSRVLKKGLEFYFNVECPEDCKDDLEKICKSVHFFGLSRNRGLGHIELSLEKVENEKNDKPLSIVTGGSEDKSPYYMDIVVESLSQLIVSDEVGKRDVSNSYISGSFLLGALAGRYLSMPDGDSSDDNFKRYFLSGAVSFPNLYPIPVRSNKEYFPAPKSIKKVKDKNKYLDLAVDDESNEKDVSLKGGIYEYVYYDDENNDLYSYLPGMGVEYHHRRPDDCAFAKPQNSDGKSHEESSKSGDFFQYEVVEKGHKFKGKILGDRFSLENIKALIKSDEIFRFGKSKVAQYGKCEVKVGEIKEAGKSPLWKKEEEMIFQLASDAIILNENGHPQPDADTFVSEICQLLEIEDDDGNSEILKRAFISTRNVGGYLGVWNLPRIQYPAIEAGSVFVLSNNTGKDIDLSKLKNGVGLRREDGFGRLIFDFRRGSGKNVSLEAEDSNLKSSFDPKKIKDDNVKTVLREILLRKLIKEMKQQGRNKLDEHTDKKIIGSVSGSFISQLKYLISNADTMEDWKESLISIFSGGDDKSSVTALRKLTDFLYFEESDGSVDIKFEKPLNNSFCEALWQDMPFKFPVDSEKDFFDAYKNYVIAFLDSFLLEKRKAKNSSREEN